MLRTTGWLLLASLASVAACTEGPDGASPPPPQATDASAQTLSVEASGCATPKFTVHLVPTSDFSFDGVLSGDLVGTVTLLFDPGSIKFTGETLSNSGTAHWVISGGTVPGLGVFDTGFKNRNQFADRPGSPATLFENIGSHRAVGGVDKANLTYKGTFTAVPPPEGVHQYQGVICL